MTQLYYTDSISHLVLSYGISTYCSSSFSVQLVGSVNFETNFSTFQYCLSKFNEMLKRNVHFIKAEAWTIKLEFSLPRRFSCELRQGWIYLSFLTRR